MNQKYRDLIMWALYALLFLLVLLVQTTIFGRVRIWGIKVSLLPIVPVCIAMHTGHESGGLFGLLAAWFYSMAGGDSGSLCMISFTLCGILAGWLCDVFFPLRIWSAAILSFCALLLHETAVYLLHSYLGAAQGRLLLWVPLTVLVSLPAIPVLYLLCKLIRKAGAAK